MPSRETGRRAHLGVVPDYLASAATDLASIGSLAGAAGSAAAAATTSG
ncbi:PE domain-containing protein [Mycobacterium camsae]|nr:PE domain-containing protein [Mycobacterium gordonae]